MRKMLAMLLSIAVLLIFAGCQSEDASVSTESATEATTEVATESTTEAVTEATTEATTVPEETEPVLDDTSIYGVDVSGMTQEEAKTAITQALQNYQLTFTANDQTFTFSASDLALEFSEEEFNSWFEKSSQGIETSTEGMITYDASSAVQTVEKAFTVAPKNATVVYNKSRGKFVSQAHKDGIRADVNTARAVLANAAATLSPTASASVKTSTDSAAIPLDDTRVEKAVKSANECLDVKLTYVYAANGIPTKEASISRDTLADIVYVNDDMQVDFSSTAIYNYLDNISYTHGGVQRRDLESSNGYPVSLQVDYYAVMLDKEAMNSDIQNCLRNKTSVKRNAPFRTGLDVNKPYGGTYVEIDLDNQRLWMYRNGSLVISSSLVSGNVSTGCATPTGVYSLYYKTKATYLVGANYRTYVDYWMPFNGGIGMHDANWRYSFGGDIYKYSGSHGCINLPTSAAATIYSNISAGTKILVYGGAQKTGMLTQVLQATDSYVLEMGAAPFNLDVVAKYTTTKIKYSSSDTNVVTVDGKGNVTVVGPGEAVITVTSEKATNVKEATMEITVKVNAEETTEPPTEPEETTTPTEPEETTTPTEPEETTTPTEPETTAPTEPETTAPTQPEETTSPTEPETTAATEPPEAGETVTE